MKVQSILALTVTAISSVIGAPVRERSLEYYTVVKNVVEVVSITSTVWVPPAQVQPTPAPETSNVEDIELKNSPEAAVKPSPKKTVVRNPQTTETATSMSSTPTPVVPVYTPSVTTSSAISSTLRSPSAHETDEATMIADTQPITETPTVGGYSGRATYYDPGVGLGSCGQQHSGDELVVAVSKDLFDAQGVANSNNNPLCGRTIKCTRNEATVNVKVVDRCPGCEGLGDLDFSMAAFKALGGTEDEGHFQFEWQWVDKY